MRRIGLAVVLVLSVLAAPPAAGAQQATKIARIGYLSSDLTGSARNREAFLQGLRDLGYIERQNFLIEYRDAERKPERLPALAAELAALKIDIIVTGGGTAAALAAKKASTTLPIVFIGVGDPVSDGLVASLARPGGNVTGFSLLAPELVGKSLELLKQAVPGVTRVALLVKPDATPNHTMNRFLKEAAVAAQALGVLLQIVEARSPADFERAFSEMSKARAGALAVIPTPVFGSAGQRLADLAKKNELPTVFLFRYYVDAGGLMSYGPDLVDQWRRAATHVDKILKGAKPGDLPVEQPTKFELVINLKTAKALGLTIPQTLLLRADQVIE
jgi:putative tryptophan/tyrosine transport system substrate-binding protein